MTDPPTLQQLRNITYRTDGWSSQIQLHDGAYEKGDLRVSLTSRVAFGDIDGDGAADAAVIIEVTGGGSGIWRQLAVVLNRGGQPVNVATVNLGDRVAIDWLGIMGRQVLIDMVDHGPQDALCCPTLQVRRTYALNNGNLALVSTSPLQRAETSVPSPASAPSVPAAAAQSEPPPATARASTETSHSRSPRRDTSTPSAPPALSNPSTGNSPAAAPPPVPVAGPPPQPSPAPSEVRSAPAPAVSHADDAVEVVTGGANPVIRFPVAHQHFASGCYGYLYFSRDAIWYEVVSPEKDKGHAFRQLRSDLELARQWKMMGTKLPEIELKFRSGTYHFIHVTRGTVEAHPQKPGWDKVLPFDDLIQAATAFDLSVRSASEGAVRATTPLDTRPSGGPAAAGAPTLTQTQQITPLSPDGAIVADSPVTLTCVTGSCSAAVLLRLNRDVPRGSITVMVVSGENLWTGTASLVATPPAALNVAIKGPVRCPIDPAGTVTIYAGGQMDRPLAAVPVSLAGSCK